MILKETLTFLPLSNLVLQYIAAFYRESICLSHVVPNSHNSRFFYNALLLWEGRRGGGWAQIPSYDSSGHWWWCSLYRRNRVDWTFLCTNPFLFSPREDALCWDPSWDSDPSLWPSILCNIPAHPVNDFTLNRHHSLPLSLSPPLSLSLSPPPLPLSPPLYLTLSLLHPSAI